MLSTQLHFIDLGTLRSGMFDEFIERKKGKKYELNKALEPYLGWTYGIIIYQEQVMQIVADVAGLGWGIANKIRKVIAKSMGEEEMMKWKDTFVNGCLETGKLSKEEAEKVFELFLSFGGYGFNLSHAVCYSYITYWDMWLKVNYPQEFYCASLTYCSEDSKQKLIDDAWRNGLEIRPPKVGISDAREWVYKDKVLYTPFLWCKGIGDKRVDEIANGGVMTIENNGFFPIEVVKPLSPKYVTLLEKIGAYTDKEMTYDDSYDLEEYFGILLKNV